MKRQLKIEVYDHSLVCPYCAAPLKVVSPMQVIFLARRNCPKCGKEFLIENSIAKRLPGEEKTQERVLNCDAPPK